MLSNGGRAAASRRSSRALAQRAASNRPGAPNPQRRASERRGSPAARLEEPLASPVREAKVLQAPAKAAPPLAKPQTQPPPPPPPRPQPYGGGYCCAVEEAALQSALRTVEAAAAGTLARRSLEYQAVTGDVLEAAYARCGTVTEDFGRTFYTGALRHGRHGCSPAQLSPSHPRGRLTALPARSARSHAADDGEAEESHLGHIRCARRFEARAPRPAGLTSHQPVWCRRTDELVDGPNSPYITPAALDRWKARLRR